MVKHEQIAQKVVNFGYNVLEHIDGVIHGITFSIPEAIDHAALTNKVRNCATYLTHLVTGDDKHGE